LHFPGVTPAHVWHVPHAETAQHTPSVQNAFAPEQFASLVHVPPKVMFSQVSCRTALVAPRNPPNTTSSCLARSNVKPKALRGAMSPEGDRSSHVEVAPFQTHMSRKSVVLSAPAKSTTSPRTLSKLSPCCPRAGGGLLAVRSCHVVPFHTHVSRNIVA
jgi:hypothetical protein